MKIFNGTARLAARRVLGSVVLPALAAMLVLGCAQIKESDDTVKHAADTVVSEQAKAQIARPVISRTSASWLLGDTVQVNPELSPILLRPIAWQPQKKVSLSELAAYITQQVGLPVDISEVQRVGGSNLSSLATPAPNNSISAGAQLPLPPAMLTAALSNAQGSKQLPLMDVAFQGNVKGLLDFAANEEGLWWKMDDGAVEFYATVTKTFYVPAINRKSTGSNSIVAQSGPGSLNSGSGTGTSGGTSGSATGSSNAADSYEVDVWKTLKDTAKTVAGSSGGGEAQVSVEPSLGSIHVTGSPTQVKNVEEWTKGLTDKLSQQVMISVSVYSVDLSNEDNYSWDPSVLYSKVANMYGLSLVAPGAPAVTGSLSPLIVSATAGKSSSLNGSQLAVKALSTLGHVAETVTQSVVTLNGQPAPMQVANEVTYLASSGSTISANVGSTSTLTPGVVTTGFTATFLPQIANGKVLLSMDMTNSVLNRIDTATSNGSSIQTPNVSSTTFQQSVQLTPGAALLLTGLQQDSNAVNRSGVGSPSSFLLGGGVDGTRAKKLIAIVITARVL
ncbi:hypothetical protein [Paraburkholderia sediminicola]|uniref:hypothetical protein n=1 Tax=Paraburkholderia sediminicola TaxID=458836 RepID=UPI0038BA381B